MITGRAGLVGLLIAGALLFSAESVEARGEHLQTRRGTLTLGGRFAFELMHVNPDPGNSQTGVMLNFSPSFGGFVVDNLLLTGALAVKVGLGDLYDRTPKLVGFGFGLQYLFNFRSIVVPYLGLSFGPGFGIPENGDTSVALAFAIPAGILISLNQHVGLNLGTEFSIGVGVSGNKATVIQLPLGFLGITGFF